MGFFSQCERKHNYFGTCTYKITSAAIIFIYHKVVTDQHIFARSSMNGVMVVCACMHIRTWCSKRTHICARSPGRIACTSRHCQRLLRIEGRKRVIVTKRFVQKLNSYILYSCHVGEGCSA